MKTPHFFLLVLNWLKIQAFVNKFVDYIKKTRCDHKTAKCNFEIKKRCGENQNRGTYVRPFAKFFFRY